MIRRELTCETLCDPANRVCLRQADIESGIAEINEAQQGGLLGVKERVAKSTEWFDKAECRMSNLALSMIELENSLGTAL